jgi:hypothetical protein
MDPSVTRRRMALLLALSLASFASAALLHAHVLWAM